MPTDDTLQLRADATNNNASRSEGAPARDAWSVCQFLADDDIRCRFDPAEVEHLGDLKSARRGSSRRTRPARLGETAAHSFCMFSQGRTLREIVVRARQPPERIRQLYSEWLVGLKDGETQRRMREQQERERRECVQDERAQLEMIKAMRA
jgi:hypothetical protein